MASRYERQRALNVVRNQSVLRDLGLKPTTVATAKKSTKMSSARKKMTTARTSTGRHPSTALSTAPSRRSQRLDPTVARGKALALRTVTADAGAARKDKRRTVEGTGDRVSSSKLGKTVAMEAAPTADAGAARKDKRRTIEGTGDRVSRRKVGKTVAIEAAPLGGGGCSCSDVKGCEQMAGLDPDTTGDWLLSGCGANGLGWHGAAPRREVATGVLLFSDASVRVPGWRSDLFGNGRAGREVGWGRLAVYTPHRRAPRTAIDAWLMTCAHRMRWQCPTFRTSYRT